MVLLGMEVNLFNSDSSSNGSNIGNPKNQENSMAQQVQPLTPITTSDQNHALIEINNLCISSESDTAAKNLKQLTSTISSMMNAARISNSQRQCDTMINEATVATNIQKQFVNLNITGLQPDNTDFTNDSQNSISNIQLSINLMQPKNSKEWHQSVTVELRNHLVEKM